MAQFWDTYTPDCTECKSLEREVADLNRAIAYLDRQLAEARKETLRYESEIAEVCPEDLTLKESIAAFKREAREQAFEDAIVAVTKHFDKPGAVIDHSSIIKALRRERDK